MNNLDDDTLITLAVESVRFAESYSTTKGWDIRNLSPEQEAEIASQDGWKIGKVYPSDLRKTARGLNARESATSHFVMTLPFVVRKLEDDPASFWHYQTKVMVQADTPEEAAKFFGDRLRDILFERNGVRADGGALLVGMSTQPVNLTGVEDPASAVRCV